MKSFWYISVIFSLILFLYGFFPIKNMKRTKVIKPPPSIADLSFNVRSLYEPKVDRVIFLVIDALRMDFVNNITMPFVAKRLGNNDSCLLEAKAESPTVTLPRVKAMTTGSVPQFIDVVFNFASSKIKEDSFLQRAVDMKKAVVFYGDDTWLKLYPNMFLRQEGTTSFFVSDFSEVDDNVTRHVADELQRTDWSILILHYLGLDHIGHMFGPFSPLIYEKLLEMDEVIKEIHTTIQNQVLHQNLGDNRRANTQYTSRTVVIVTGDHGMKDSGGHGGSTASETTVPLIFLGLGCKPSGRQIKQTDIAATVATLMGIPLPANSIGTTLPEILVNYNIESALYIQYYNSINLLRKYADIQVDFDHCFSDHINFVKERKGNGSEILNKYNEVLSKVSDKLIKITTTQNIPLLYISCCIMICCVLKLVLVFYARLTTFAVTIIWISLCAEIVTFSEFRMTLVLSIVLTTLTLLLSFFALVREFKKFVSTQSFETVFLTSATVLKTFSLSSTSFIEEEHQTWYFFWGTLAVLQARQSCWVRKDSWLWIATFIGLRIIRMLNQVGDKWAHLPDISDWLNRPCNYVFLSLFFLAGVAGTVMCCLENTDGDNFITAMFVPTFFFVAWHGLFRNVFAAQMVRVCTLVIAALRWYDDIYFNAQSIVLLWILWCVPMLRLHNLILLPICYYTAKLLQRLKKNSSVISRTILHMWLSMVMVHCQGICNSIASIDVAPGYVGLQKYFPLITALQILSHVCTFPVLTYLLLYKSFNVDKSTLEYQIIRRTMLNTLIICQVFNVVFFCLVMLMQRDHLFIWTVFAPKLLIESVHTFLLLFVMTACNFNLLKWFKVALRTNRVPYRKNSLPES